MIVLLEERKDKNTFFSNCAMYLETVCSRKFTIVGWTIPMTRVTSSRSKVRTITVRKKWALLEKPVKYKNQIEIRISIRAFWSIAVFVQLHRFGKSSVKNSIMLQRIIQYKLGYTSHNIWVHFCVQQVAFSTCVHNSTLCGKLYFLLVYYHFSFCTGVYLVYLVHGWRQKISLLCHVHSYKAVQS